MAHPLISEVRPRICMARPLIASTDFYFQVVCLEVILVVHFGGTKRARPLIAPTICSCVLHVFYNSKFVGAVCGRGQRAQPVGAVTRTPTDPHSSDPYGLPRPGHPRTARHGPDPRPPRPGAPRIPAPRPPRPPWPRPPPFQNPPKPFGKNLQILSKRLGGPQGITSLMPARFGAMDLGQDSFKDGSFSSASLALVSTQEGLDEALMRLQKGLNTALIRP